MEKKNKNSLRVSTQLCHDDDTYFEHHGAIVPPIYQNSLFAFESWDAIDQAFADPPNSFIYSRVLNPTAQLAEKKIADLCHGEKAKLYASGMGAISAAILYHVNHGDHIVTIKNLYAPANNFISQFLAHKCGITVSYVSGTDVQEFESAITDKTTLFYLECPSSIVFELQDLKAVAALAKRRNIKTIIDNTWASPLFQKPLDMGIDMEVHSVSKYLCGHSDVVAGVIVGTATDLDAMQMHEHALLGAKIAPIEAWLILRSLRTLPLRMRRHQESTVSLAEYLENHPSVQKVNFPGLPSFPQYQLGQQQMSGYGGLLSFELQTKDFEKIKSFVNALSLFKLGVSWGGHESLVYAPLISYSRELTKEQFDAMGIVPGLIRLSIGLEDVDDLIADLEVGFLEVV
jgi:cystathionine beta-lyase/cystathionine gamma-synthase